MKRINIIRILSASTLTCLAIAGVSLATAKNKVSKANAGIYPSTSLPTTNIDLSDCTNQQIKDYYDALNGKSADQLKGTNLLKNLKSILQNGVKFYTYDDVSKAYLITDRDWTDSPANTFSNFDGDHTITSISYSTEENKNPYLHLLYCDYDIQGKTRYKGDGDVSSTSVSFDKEHVWSQTHGFKDADKGENLTGAGSDLHHLKAGTQYGNRTLHSNYSYGFVKENDADWSSKTYETKNKRGAPLFPHDDDQQNRVFEPQDSDKGDIARALLYMVACYNNFDGGEITPENPALQLVNYVISGSTTGYSSDDIQNGFYGALQDILVWHKMDPVDSYEIHRNNLIYKNFQNNRNPFIDYPQWVDYIWGTAYIEDDQLVYNDEPTGSVDLNNDVINGYRALKTVTKIEVTKAPRKTTYYVDEPFDTAGMTVTATFNDSTTANVTDDCIYTADTSAIGNTDVTIEYGGQSTTQSITVIARTAPVSSVSLNKTQMTLEVGDSATLNAHILPDDASNKNVTWQSDNTSVATVVNGEVSALAEGTATITVTTVDGGKTATCLVNVIDSSASTIVSDVLNKAFTGNPSSYTDWSNKQGASGAVYSGKSSGTYSSIQLSNTTASGIVTTTSGGTAKKVTIEFDSHTGSGRIIQIYGKNSAYTAYTDIGTGDTLIGTIVNGTSTELVITSSYEYIGIKVTGGAAYLTSIAIDWYTATVEATGVNISSSNLTLGVGEEHQLTATVLPLNSTNKTVTWTSNNTSVAIVDSEGNVVGQAPGNATISVETQDGGFIEECSVTVSASSPYVNNVPYKFYLLKDSVKRYIDGGTGSKTYYGTTTTTYADGVDVYFEQNGKGQNMYFYKNSVKTYISIVLSGTWRNFNLSTTAPTNPWLYDATLNTLYVSISGAKYILGVNGDYVTIAAYSVTAENLQLCYVQETAESLSHHILNKITCDNTGVNAPQFADGYSWTNLEAIYNSLDESEKTVLQTSNANQIGSTIEQAMARYDFILKKYKITTFTDFIGRNPQGSMRFVITGKNNSLILTVMISSSILASCLAAFLLLRKRKQR